MSDSTNSRRCELCNRPLRPDQTELCADCEAEVLASLDEREWWTDDMQNDVDHMNARVEPAHTARAQERWLSRRLLTPRH
jgi:hypothetical protein